MPSCRFKFVPRLPTASAYNNREFGDFSDSSSLFGQMIANEKNHNKKYTGYIYYKKGFESDHGATVIHNNPQWWLSGARSCIRGCCKNAPEGYILGTKSPEYIQARAPWAKTFQEFKHVSGPDGLAEQFYTITKKEGIDKIWINNCGWFWVIYSE